MNKRLLFLAFALIAAAILTACSAGDLAVSEVDFGSDAALVADGDTPRPGPAALTGDDMPITRGLVAKMLALAFSDSFEIDNSPRIINFTDTDATMWYDRFINKVVSLGLLWGSGDQFSPNDPLTLEQAQIILDRLDPSNPIRIQLTDDNRQMAVSYALWVNLYMQLLENLAEDSSVAERFGIIAENVVVLITPEFNPRLPAGHVITNRGHFTGAGLPLDIYMDKEISILRKGAEIVAVVGITNPMPIIYNAFVVASTEDTITIFAGGAERTFRVAGPVPAGIVADLRINGRAADVLRTFDYTTGGAVKEFTDSVIEIEGLGRLLLHEAFAVYSLLGETVALSRPKDIIIGYDVANFVIRDGRVAAAVIQRRPVPSYIRVVLSTTGFGSRIHPFVELRAEMGFVINYSGGRREVAPGEVFRLSSVENTDLVDGGRISLIPNYHSKIEIMSISRNWPDGASPRYRGILEIVSRPGGFVIVNELSLEEYLFAVIPSEMPAAFGLEAAKVQSITARSYAYTQFFMNRFYMYGAHVDDSVHSQVYNNFPETETAIAAVNATRGMFLTYAGSVISANFFSTSSGKTANSSDVWINAATSEFDAPTPPYLRATPQIDNFYQIDLSQEQNARAFFTNTALTGFDDSSPWFRWNFELTNEELTQIINGNLYRLAPQTPQLFRLAGTPPFPPQFAITIGDFESMEVISRGEGGNIRELLIHGSTNSVLIRTEYAIRQLLRPSTPAGVTLRRHNSAPVTNHFILPSTFMTFEQIPGGLRFYGGGFGHGVGMSQHGVFGMVQRGYNYREILAHFYPGTTVN